MRSLKLIAILAVAAFAGPLLAANEQRPDGTAAASRPAIPGAHPAALVPVASEATVDGLSFDHLRSDLARLNATRRQIWQLELATQLAWERL